MKCYTVCSDMTCFFMSPAIAWFLCLLACLLTKGNADCDTVRCGYYSSCKYINGTARCICDLKCGKWMSPVCGSDGVTYGNECQMKMQSCLLQQMIHTKHIGSCSSMDRNCFSPPPPPPKNSKYIRDNNNNYFVHCDHGYYRQGDARLKCRNGTWEVFASCQKKACSHPGPLENGRIDFGQFSFGSKATYECNLCFYLDGPKERECLGNETWSGVKPVCKAIDCGHMLQNWELENGIAFGHDTFCGSAIEFQCFDDYKLVGSQSAICQADGKWSARKPECRLIADSPSTPSFQPSRECIRLANPRNGRIRNLVSDNIYLPGHEVLFECDDQYELIGTSILTCMDNGTWSHPAPSCILSYCNVAEGQAPKGGFHLGSNLIGSSRLFFCYNDRKLVGPSSIHCKKNGKWSSRPPVCLYADSDVNIEDNIKLCPLCNIQKDICQTIRSSNFTLVGKINRETDSSYLLRIKMIIKDSKRIATINKDVKILKISSPRCVCFSKDFKGDILITGSYVTSSSNDLALYASDYDYVGRFYGTKQISSCF